MGHRAGAEFVLSIIINFKLQLHLLDRITIRNRKVINAKLIIGYTDYL